MEPYNFKSYKISLKLPLDNIAFFFNLPNPLNREEYITLDSNQISNILQYKIETKIVCLFRYGCVCFVNFNEDEIYIFLKYIDSIISGVNYNLFSGFRENHAEYIDENGSWNTSYIQIICIVLAKSVELHKLETDLEGLLDKAEMLINNLQVGKLSIKKKFILTTSRILRLEYHYANNIKILERNIYDNKNIESRSTFDRLSKQYELDERLKVIQSKMNDMRTISAAYYRYSYNQRETRTLWFEIVLLSLFPLSYILDIIDYKDIVFKILRVLFP